MKKVISAITGLLALSLLALAGSFEYEAELQSNGTTTAWTNSFAAPAIAISSAMFTVATSGSYTCQVDLVTGTFTNRLLSQAITLDRFGTWLPESDIWVERDSVLQVTVLGAATNNLADARIQFSSGR